jgi:uncharacterized protein (DUF736 family)
MIIGSLSAYDDLYTGTLSTLCIDAMLTFVPAPPSDERHPPDWMVMRGGEDSSDEIGTGWNRLDADGGAIIAVQIDDPTFRTPIHAELLLSMLIGGAHPLSWVRPSTPWGAFP